MKLLCIYCNPCLESLYFNNSYSVPPILTTFAFFIYTETLFFYLLVISSPPLSIHGCCKQFASSQNHKHLPPPSSIFLYFHWFHLCKTTVVEIWNTLTPMKKTATRSFAQKTFPCNILAYYGSISQKSGIPLIMKIVVFHPKQKHPDVIIPQQYKWYLLLSPLM